MSNSDVLQRVRIRAAELVALNLRSASVVLARMRDLICEAHASGHSHKAIHASLEAAGLRATWNTYKSCLVRMKKASGTAASSSAVVSDSASQPPPSAANPPVVFSREPGPSIAGALGPPDIDHPGAIQPTSSATRVMDALAEARKVASRDYAQIARDLYRQQQREQRDRLRKEFK